MEGLQAIFPTPFFYGDYKDIPFEKPHADGLIENVVKVDVPELKDAIFNSISGIIQEMGSVDQPLVLNDMWFNTYDERRPILNHHYHQNCSWTGTYFPYDANHTTQFFNPYGGLIYQHFPKQERVSDFTTEYVSAREMKAGQGIIHPSYIPHQVFWNGGEPSYSISFDVAYQTPIGDKAYGSYRE